MFGEEIRKGDMRKRGRQKRKGANPLRGPRLHRIVARLWGQALGDDLGSLEKNEGGDRNEENQREGE